MTASGWFAWQLAALRGQWSRFLVAGLGVAVGIGALVFFLALGSGLKRFALGSFADQIDARLLEVVPRSMELGFFRLNRPGLFGSSGLDEQSLERLRHVEHVSAVYPRRLLRLPMGAEGGERFFGKAMYSDVLVEGLPRALLAKSVPELSAAASPGEPIPVVINNQLLDLYNGSVADALHLPKLAAGAAVGVSFNLIVGRSYLLGSSGAKKVETRRAKLAGFSPYAMRVGLTLPLDTVDNLEHEFQSEPTPTNYTSVLVELDRASSAPAVNDAVQKLGLVVSESGRRTANAIRLAGLALSLIALLILTLAAFNIGYTFLAQFIERRAEFALLKALGAGPSTLVLLIVSQGLLIGLLGGVCGLLFGTTVAEFVDRALLNWVSDIPLRPEHFFIVEGWILPVALAVAAGCALCGVCVPLLRALGDSPARILASVE